MVEGFGNKNIYLKNLYGAALLNILKVYTTHHTISPLRRSEVLKLLWKNITVFKSTGRLGS